MNGGIVLRSLGALLGLLGLMVLAPLATAWHHGEPLAPWLATMLAAVALGGGLWIVGRSAKPSQLGLREGIAITCLTWGVGSLVAGIGVALAVPEANFLHGWFEMMSALTTTGSSVFGGPVLPAIEALPQGVLMWRSVGQLLGGIGIVVISLALLPLLVSGSGFQLYRAEVTGLHADRLAPRIVDTARILVGLYAGLFLATMVALRLAGVGWGDAFHHAACSVSTGGFSPYDDSVEGLGNDAAEWIVIATMFLASINFALLFAAVRGKPLRLWRSEEVRVYVALLVCASAIVILSLELQSSVYDGRLHDLLRDGIFQAVSIGTTTGFATGYDTGVGSWEGWPALAQMVLLGLMIGGACAGSTTGGVKLVRVIVLAKICRRELRRHVEPHRITPINLDGRPLPDHVLLHVAGFFIAYVLAWVAGTVALTIFGSSPPIAAAAALSCLSNIGPAYGELGAAHNFGNLPWESQLVCTFLMLLGRLELFGVLMALDPRNWRR